MLYVPHVSCLEKFFFSWFTFIEVISRIWSRFFNLNKAALKGVLSLFPDMKSNIFGLWFLDILKIWLWGLCTPEYSLSNFSRYALDYLNLAWFVININLMLHFPCWQDSPSFSFYKCLPSGWTVLLFSGIATLLSERIFLDRENFWQTFAVHLSIGLACFSASSFVMYLLCSLILNLLLYILDIPI